MLINKHNLPNWEDITTDFQDNCYHNNLELEENNNTQYLECEIINNHTHSDTTYWNKNIDPTHQTFYKHQHAHVFNPTNTKQGAIIGTWTRINSCTSTTQLLLQAITHKHKEFTHLGYLPRFLHNTLLYMARKQNSPIWNSIASFLPF